MTISITSSSIDNVKKIVHIEGQDMDEIQLKVSNREREDQEPRTLHFLFDTTDKKTCEYICKWLHKQKAARGSKTYGEAIRAVVGTVTIISGRYIIHE